ncbi:hypothetical protein NMG60_11024553 [Bertholletia excelsa]
MAGGETPGARSLERTPTWAVALVCGIIVIISILLEKILHHVGELFKKRNRKHMLAALEKIKGELMVLGFISLLLTFGQNYIAAICIPQEIGDHMLPCRLKGHHKNKHHHSDHAPQNGEHHRRLLWYEHRFLAADSDPKGCKLGHVPLISKTGLHQLHIFIFFLATFHVMYSAITMVLGKLKTRRWKEWEIEAANDEKVNGKVLDDTIMSRGFRLTHETSFVKDHTRFWTKSPFLFYLACFFRQFFRSVTKADYLSMRQGFISVHLAPGSKFDFQKYIKRSLEDDFKVVVGIRYFCLPDLYLLLMVTLAVGTKLQAIISQMAIEIQEKHAVVQGIPLVQVSDRHFWFSWPELILHLIHLTLFQNAFEITHFIWISYEFGFGSCFHDDYYLILVRVAFGIGILFLCSYITLPLYALVTQMGSHMKRSIFDEQTSKALMHWHQSALKKKTEVKPGKIATRTLGGSPDDTPEHTSRGPNPSPLNPSEPDEMATIEIPLDSPPARFV